MEKISGILPGSPRLMSVDLKDAAPVRPGTPSFGRPEGYSSLKEAAKEASLTTAKKAMGVQSDLMDWKTKDAEHAAVAAQLSEKFFSRNQRDAEPMPDMSRQVNLPALRASESTLASRPAGFKTDEVGSFRANANSRPSFNIDDEEETQLSQPEGLYPKGSFIDRTV